jgi:hypothetical protein
MVKIAKTDVRAALRDILRDEMGKQQKAELDETMQNLYKESYTDECPYCKQLLWVMGTDENVKLEEVGGKKYMVKACDNCKKKVYVKIVMTSPKSMLDTPGTRAYFFTKEYVYGEPEAPVPLTEPSHERKKLNGGVWRG